MKTPIRLLVAIALAVCGLVQVADAATQTQTRFKWRDAQGSLHFSDTLPPEALQMGYDVVDTQGLVIRHVDRPRSAAERKAEASAAAEREEATRRSAEIAATDRLLLATYPTEEDLAAVHKDRLDALEKTLSNVEVSLADQEKGLSDQLAHAETFERDGKPVPISVKREIETLRKTIEGQHAFITRREQERVELIKQSEQEISHYRQLKAKAQAAQQ